MNTHEFVSLKARSKEAWIKMERWRLAYRSDHKSIGNRANYLKWGTVIGGVLTGASSLSFLGEDPTKYITGIAGFMTGVLAVMDKAFQWESNANEAWRNSKLLEDLQSDLYQYLWAVSASKLIESPESYLAKINNKLISYTSLPCIDPDQFLAAAQEASKRFNFENMVMIDHAVPDEADDDDLLPEEVDGIDGFQPIIDRGDF
ncbi:hypothetical protein CXF72_00680 [Psychromonas sp. MB-3u-54]|uniref:hypothetical protein n=1 Tax=Psychromonas sp. MB-3u-54 TaxID=2058319 RepID=UPI000C33D9D8|nr:hypothetical protein [Psychromonas sp. MB-3u-54]PKH04432.1 hypothetical protein CXF72_00680 [Psychromonas sp. MB-3u-54]